MSIRWKSLLLALAVIIGGGVLRLPLEQRYTAEMRRRNLLETPLNISLRDELEQTAFFAVLGGFRGVVASIMELQAITPWQQSNYAKVDECYAICTRLQPREVHYWEMRGFHQAYNARDTYRYESRLTEANREIFAQQAIDNGIRILREGLVWLPKSWKLWDRLGNYYSMTWNYNPDYNLAAECFAKAASIEGSPGVLRRLHVYQVAKVPEREWEAWGKLLELYNSPRAWDRTQSVEVELLYLYSVKRISERHPEAVLPAELDLFLDRTAVLTAEQKKHRAQLKEAMENRLKSSPPPRVKIESPGLQKER